MLVRSLTFNHRLAAIRLTLLLLLTVVFLLMSRGDAYALPGIPLPGGSGCSGTGLLARIVPCIANTIEKSTTTLTNSLSTYLWPATSALILLVIVLYGLRIMTPEGNAPKTAVPLLIKIAFVMAFVTNFGGFIPAVHGGMQDIVNIVGGALPQDFGKGQCPSSGTVSTVWSLTSAGGSQKVWVNLDCILGKLFGFVGKDGNVMLIASVFGLMAGFFFGGSFGLIAFFAVISVLWGIFMFAFRAAFAFLNGFLLASFMVIISPMMIPLILLQSTAPYFQSWLRIFMGAFIMPIVVIGYCVFALSIYNQILFEDDSAISIRKVMDINFAKSVTGMRTECMGSLLNSVIFRQFEAAAGGRDLDEVLKSNSVQNMSIPQQSGGQGLCIKVPNIDIHKISDGFKNKQDFFRQIFTDSMALLLLAWLLLAAMEAVIQMSGVLGGSVASALMGPVSPMEKRLKSAWEQAKGQAQQSMIKPDGSSYAGAEFLQRVPIAFKEMVTGGIRGVS